VHKKQPLKAGELRMGQLEFYEFILSHIADAVVALDNDQKIVYFNQAAELLYGVKAEQVVGKSLEAAYKYRWLNPGDEQTAARKLKTSGFWTGQNIHIKKHGQEIIVESRVTTMTDKNGKMLGLLAVIRDVTFTSRMIEQLHKLVDHYESITPSRKSSRT
jgi:PAS domain S-box-containing protein